MAAPAPIDPSSAARSKARTAERRAEAARTLRAGVSLAVVRLQLKLSRADEQALTDDLWREYPWLAVVLLPPEIDDDPFCPEVSPHPAVPLPNCVRLTWFSGYPGKGRLVAYTCECVMTTYELLTYGGLYRIRRTTARGDVPAVSYTGGWRRGEAFEWWTRVLSGLAR